MMASLQRRLPEALVAEVSAVHGPKKHQIYFVSSFACPHFTLVSRDLTGTYSVFGPLLLFHTLGHMERKEPNRLGAASLEPDQEDFF